MQVKIKKLDERAKMPVYGTEYSAGADLYSMEGDSVTIKPHTTAMIKLGFAIEIPEGYAGLIFARSGLASKRGLAPANKVGVVDSDYRGEVCVVLHNHGQEAQTIENGDRIAQLVITPVLQPAYEAARELDDTARSSGGFGSTGK